MFIRTPVISQYTPTDQVIRSILTEDTPENTAVLAVVPHLFNKMSKYGTCVGRMKIENPSLYQTLRRYALRMKYEAVPYKLFAGISECKINVVDQVENYVLNIEPNYRAIPNVEGESVFQQQIDRNIEDSVCHINNTLVLSQNRSYYSYIYRTLHTDGLKFIHTRRKTGQIEIIDFLKREFSGLFMIDSLVNKLVSDGYSQHDVESFVNKLVNQQVIINGTALDLHAQSEMIQYSQPKIYYDLCGIDRVKVYFSRKMISELDKFSQSISQYANCFRLNKVADYLQKEYDYQLVNLSRLFWNSDSFNKYWQNQITEYQEYRSQEISNIKKLLTSSGFENFLFSSINNELNLYRSARCRVVEVDGQVKLQVLSLDNILPNDYYSRFTLNAPLQSQDLYSSSQADTTKPPSVGILHCDDLKAFNISKHAAVTGSKEITVYDNTACDQVESIKLDQLYIAKDRDKLVRLFVINKNGFQEINARINSLANPLRNSIDEVKLLYFIDRQKYPTGVSFDTIFNSNTESHFPRLEVGSLVISPRCWTVSIRDISQIGALQSKLIEICNDERAILCLESSKVLIDLRSEDDIAIVLSAGKKRGYVHLSEYLPPPNNQINHEIIVPLNHKNNTIPIQNDLHLPALEPLNVDPNWIYIRIYCNQYQYLLLLQKIGMKFFVNNEHDWFFIVYEDEVGFHLRLRIKLRKKDEEAIVKMSLVKAISEEIFQHLVHEYTFTRYKPEYLKYGLNEIHQFETLFYQESQSLLNVIHEIIECEQKRLAFGISRIIGNVKLLFNENDLVVFFLRDIVDEHLNASAKKEIIRKQLAKSFQNQRDFIAKQVEYYLENSCFVPIKHITELEGVKHFLHTICNRVYADITFEKEIMTYYFALRLVSKWDHHKKIRN